MLPLVLALAVQPVPKDADTARAERWEKEIAAVEKRLKDHPPKAGGVVFAGSSTARLWKLDESFPGKGYVNVGFGGSELRDSTHFAARLIAPHRPKAVVLYAGDNDVAAGRTPEQVAADFKGFVAAVRKDAPDCKILFLAVKPSPARWKQVDVQKKANALVKSACDADPKLAYVDVVPLMLGTDGTPVVDLYAKDGLHLSPAGYARWTAAVAAALDR
ncbi:MAG TPA: GDSL-type esterase/lipase family protein [Urbifossiella sp.]|jgi:lysophospholipase L1-like esterase|nr:GDSL-type esterase/lipase family protein [Urbifossiella sp.]